MSFKKQVFGVVSLLVICICACGPTLTMPGNTLSNHYMPATGVNTANLFLYCPDLLENHDLVAGVLKKEQAGVLRFPGGTTANFYHPNLPGYGFRNEDLALLKESGVKEHMGKVVQAEGRILKKHGIDENFIYAFTKLVETTDHQVLYVANLLSGTLEETLSVLNTFKRAGIRVSGVELGNEYYLKAYEERFASVRDYIDLAKVFAAGIRKEHPDVPISLVAAPTADIKSISQREVEWNKALAGLDFFEAVSVHFYPRSDRMIKLSPSPCTIEEAIEMGFNRPRKALRDLEQTFEGKELWLTEWNVAAAPKWCNNSIAHAFFTGLFQESLSESKQLNVSIYHTLVSKSNGFNLYNPDPILGLKPLPNIQSFELSAKLRSYLQATGVVWEKAVESLPDNCLQFSFSNEKKETRAVVIYNAGGKEVAIDPEISISQHWELSARSLEQGSLILKENNQRVCDAGSISLFLIR